MGAVRSSLAINDGMTPALRRINNAMRLMLSNFQAVQRTSGRAIDTENLSLARRELDLADRSLDEIEQSYRDCNSQQEKLNKSIGTGTSKAGGLLGKIKSMATAYLSMQTLGSLVELSDTQAQTTARLGLIVDDNNTVASLEDKIFASAQRSRGAYQTTADAVSKLGMQAADAFKGNDELIAFTELLNKQFVIAGTSAQGVDSVMLQITQSMAAGKLQGEELNAVLDNAQPVVANIKKYLEEVQNIDASNIKELASDGKITADVIKNAMFYAADDINDKFDSMPTTWSQVWTNMKNRATRSLDGVLVKINELANNPKVQRTVDGLIQGFTLLASVAGGVFEVICNVYNFIADNWSWISPIIMGIVAALLLYKLTMLASSVVLGIMCAAEAAKTAMTLSEAIATGSATAAQTAFNTALWACPITWIIAAIIALIVVFVIFTEQIMGAIFWLGALFKNVGLWIANCGIAAWQVIKNVGLWFANLGLAIWQVIKNIGAWFGNLGQSVWAIIKNTGLWFANLGMGIWNVLKAAASNVGTAFSNAWISIQIGFWTMLDVIMQGIKSLAEKANACLGWMGVNIDTSGLDFASKKIDELNGKKESYKSISEAWNEGFNTFAYDSVSDAWNTYDYGSVGDAMGTFDYGSVGDAFNTFDTFQDGWGSDAYDAGAEVGAGIKDWMGDNLSMDNLLKSVGADAGTSTDADLLGYGDTLDDIAGDTSSLADSTDKTTEELEYLRDIAEQEAINRFTTAEIKVDMTGMTNRIDSNMDIDGVISYLTVGLEDALNTAAEGVH